MSLLLKDGRIITGDGSIREGHVLIEDGRIKAIGRFSCGSDYRGESLDLKKKTLMPGLIDCHTHLGLGSSKLENHGEKKKPLTITELALQGAANAYVTLKAGFTTVREVGGLPGTSGMELRDMIAEGRLPGPRIHVCGGGLAMTGGHGWEILSPGLREVDGPHEARKGARLQLKAGANVLKIMASRAGSDDDAPGGPEFTIPEMAAICEEAQKRGVPCTAHAVGAEAIKNAIEAGLNSIDHGCLLTEELMDRMIEKEVFLVATVWVYLCQEERGLMCGYPSHVIERSKEINEVYGANVKQAFLKGVKIGLGSDCGLGVTPHGENGKELVQLVERVGLSPMDTIRLATRGGAEVLGLEKELGTVEEGMIADLLVIDGDPLEDISILCQPHHMTHVIKEGRIVVGGKD